MTTAITSSSRLGDSHPLVMGLSVFGHDSSAVLLDGVTGKILYAVTEERFSNVKHDGGFPAASVELLCDRAITEELGVINYIALNIDPEIFTDHLESEIRRKLSGDTQLFLDELKVLIGFANFLHPNYFPLNYLELLLSKRGLDDSAVSYISGKISWYGNSVIRYRKLKQYLQAKFPSAKIISVGHHLCHAASAFFCSEFQSAAVLTIDGQGEIATATLNKADGTCITELAQMKWPHSLGALYMQIAWYLGFDGDTRYPGFGDEFKVMGMAAYGTPIYIDIFRKMGQITSDGSFEFVFGEYLQLEDVQGCPGHVQPVLGQRFFADLGKRRAKGEEIEQKHFDIAKSGQVFLEEIAVGIAKHLKILCADTDDLCLAGGVALNGLMNMQIYRHAGFKNIFIQPASGDDGTSLGAALHVYHHLLKGGRCEPLLNAYLGFDYGRVAIIEALHKYELNFVEPDSIHVEVGRLLHEGKIIARYHGRSEFGPRALGNRSILGNPTIVGMKDSVNAQIKHREAFRPFAPACLEEAAAEYFDIDVSTPFMLLICQAQEGVRARLPAVVHDDGTARLQTVSEDQNPDFYQIIVEFSKRSGVPVVLNTSFNVNGESIVETPLDAVESFLFMGIDYLAIGPFLVSRVDINKTYRRPALDGLIAGRRLRYQQSFFSPELFVWDTTNPVETDLVILEGKERIQRVAAAERLTVIERLDEEVKFLKSSKSKNAPENRSLLARIKSWVQ